MQRSRPVSQVCFEQIAVTMIADARQVRVESVQGQQMQKDGLNPKRRQNLRTDVIQTGQN